MCIGTKLINFGNIATMVSLAVRYKIVKCSGNTLFVLFMSIKSVIKVITFLKFLYFCRLVRLIILLKC